MMKANNKQKGDYHRNVWLLYASAFLNGFLFYLPVIVLYLQGKLGGMLEVATAFAATSILIIVFEVPTGAIADRYGRKRTLVLSSILFTLSVLTLALVNSFIMVVAWVILLSFAVSLASGTDTALLYDSIAKSKVKRVSTKRALGIHGGMWQLGASISAVIGGFIAAHSIPATIWLSLIPTIIGIGCVLALVEVPYRKSKHTNIFRHMGEGIRLATRNAAIFGVLLVALALNSFSEIAYNLDQPLFAEKAVPIALFGVVFGIIYGLSFLGSYLSEPVSKRFGDRKTLIWCRTIGFAIMCIALLFRGPAVAFIIASSAVVWGVQWPIVMHRMHTVTPSRQRATIGSILNFSKNIGLAILFPIFGYICDLWSVTTAVWLCTIFGLISLVPIMYAFKATKGVRR